jgi:hypothetical protein
MQDILDLRIRQLHESMGAMRTADLSGTKVTTTVEADMFYQTIDFSDGMTDAQLANSVSLLIANIARLKDHLKVWCDRAGAPFRGEQLINSNRDVGLIHDLWNRDKHGGSRGTRSGLDPELRNIMRELVLATGDAAGSSVSMSFDPRTGQMVVEGDGKAELVIDADIVDRSGTRVGGLIEVAERATTAWEQLLTATGVSVPKAG